MKRVLAVFAVLLGCLLPAHALAGGGNELVLDVSLFEGHRANAPANEPSSVPVVLLPPDPGWSGEIEKQRQQIAESLGLDGATLLARMRVGLPPGSSRTLPVPRENAPPLLIEIKPERIGASRVSLEIHLRDKGAPDAELASVSVSGDIGKTVIVGARPSNGPLLVAVTPREPSSVPDGPGEGDVKVGGEVKPPVLLKRVEARYPDKLRGEKKSGVVVIQTTVDERGRISNPAIVRHSEPEFDAAALEALRQWEYAPATLNEKPVPVQIKIAINFTVK